MAARPQWRNTVGPKSHPDRPVYFKEFHTSEKDVNDKDFAEVGHKVLQHHVLHEKKASEFLASWLTRICLGTAIQSLFGDLPLLRFAEKN